MLLLLSPFFLALRSFLQEKNLKFPSSSIALQSYVCNDKFLTLPFIPVCQKLHLPCDWQQTPLAFHEAFATQGNESFSAMHWHLRARDKTKLIQANDRATIHKGYDRTDLEGRSAGQAAGWPGGEHSGGHYFAPKIFLWRKRRTHLICENKHQFWISEKFLEGIINTNN